MYIRYIGVVCKCIERVIRWNDKEVLIFEGDDFGFGSGMGNFNVCFCGFFGC